MSCIFSESSPQNEKITNWIDLTHLCPRNPLTLIAMAKIDHVVGAYQDSATFINPPA